MGREIELGLSKPSQQLAEPGVAVDSWTDIGDRHSTQQDSKIVLNGRKTAGIKTWTASIIGVRCWIVQS